MCFRSISSDSSDAAARETCSWSNRKRKLLSMSCPISGARRSLCPTIGIGGSFGVSETGATPPGRRRRGRSPRRAHGWNGLVVRLYASWTGTWHVAHAQRRTEGCLRRGLLREELEVIGKVHQGRGQFYIFFTHSTNYLFCNDNFDLTGHPNAAQQCKKFRSFLASLSSIMTGFIQKWIPMVTFMNLNTNGINNRYPDLSA